MPISLPIPFESEVDALRKQGEAVRQLTSRQRLQAAADAASAADALSRAGQVRAAQLEYHQTLELEWRQRMKEFIDQHVSA